MATASRTHKVSPSTPMPRATRSMTLSFGMFQVGVAWGTLFSADTGIKSHLTCPEHHGRVKQAWYCEHGDHYVERMNLDATFEYAGQNIVLGDSEVKGLEAERDGVIALKSAAYTDTVDPAYFEKSYLMWPTPGKQNEQAFRALLTAMRNSDMSLIGQVVVSKTDRALVIRYSKEFGCLIAHVCNYGANVKESDVAKVHEGEQVWPEPPAEFVAQAEALLTTLCRDFDPNAVEDTYQANLAAALYAKSTGTKVEVEDDAPTDAQVPDMMAMLKASIEAANA